MRNTAFKLATPLLFLLASCGAPATSDEPNAWELDSDYCPNGTIVDTGLPDVDLFDRPICLVNHPADEVQIQWANQRLLRPECSTDIFEDPRELGHYGDIGFVTAKRATIENNVCTSDLMNSCANYNIYLRVPRVSNVWHRFEIRRPNENCDYGHEIYAGEYYWYWRFKVGNYLWIASFRSSSWEFESSRYHHIKIYDQECGRVSDIEQQKVIQKFSVLDIIFESLPSKKTYSFYHPEPDYLNTSTLRFYTPIIGAGCIDTSGEDWIQESS